MYCRAYFLLGKEQGKFICFICAFYVNHVVVNLYEAPITQQIRYSYEIKATTTRKQILHEISLLL